MNREIKNPILALLLVGIGVYILYNILTLEYKEVRIPVRFEITNYSK